jgi:acyl-CoA thioesterase-1
VNGLNPMVEELAEELNLPCIDLYSPMMGRDDLFPDQIHPNAEGAGIMAQIIYEALTGKTIE